MLSILGLHCGEGAAPSSALPPAVIYTASINPSIHPSFLPSFHQTHKRKIAYPSSTVSRKQSRQANQATNAPKSYIFVPVHDLSITYVFSPNPSNQQAKQAEPTNTLTKGSGIQKNGQQPNYVFTKCCRYLPCIGGPPSNQQTKQPKPHNPLFSSKAVNIWFALQQASQPTNTPSRGRRVKKKGSRVKKERVEGEKKKFDGELDDGWPESETCDCPVLWKRHR